MLRLNLRPVITLFAALSIFLFSYCDESTGPTINSLKSAEKNLFVNLLNSNDSGKVVYELLYRLTAGTIVKTGDVVFDTSKYKAPTNSWFFFIDDHPELRYSHSCRYVFSDIYSSNLTVYDAQFYPECLDEMKIVIFQ
jgi:hypothetical protein